MPALESNQQFERYRIMRWLGNGVSGESYEAVDTMLQRKVALKLIHPWSTLPDSARRQFFREMQGISILNHPFLATTLDYGELDGRLYVVRRYLNNGSLLSNESRLWFKLPFSVDDAIRYAHQLAQSLDYIHNHGYLHGALTLSNILVLRGPNVDHESGYAPFLLADVGLTNFVRRFGHPQITLLPVTAAPEQIGKRVTPASDQFALAVLLYFWLAGRPPYLGTPEETEQAKLNGTFPPLFLLNPDISYQQEEVLRRALNIYPEDRYPSVTAFADALMATLTPPKAPNAATLPFPSPIETPPPDSMWQSAPIPAVEAVTSLTPPPASSPTFEQILDALTHHSQPAIQHTPQPPLLDIEEITTAAEAPTTTEPPAHQLEKLVEMEEKQAGQSIAIPRLLIKWLSGGETIEYLLEHKEIMLGHAGSDDILLDQDSSTSRHHALLKYEDDQYVIYDQRSTSGVFVNGEKLNDGTGRILLNGDHILIGNYELIYRRCNFGVPLQDEHEIE